jgi:hypothetical protein
VDVLGAAAENLLDAVDLHEHSIGSGRGGHSEWIWRAKDGLRKCFESPESFGYGWLARMLL